MRPVFGLPILFWVLTTPFFQMMAFVLIYERFHIQKPETHGDLPDRQSVKRFMKEIMMKTARQNQNLRSESDFRASRIHDLTTTIRTERLENRQLRELINIQDEETANLRSIIRDQEEYRRNEEHWSERQLITQIEAIQLNDLAMQCYYNDIERFTKFHDKERALQRAQVAANKIKTQVGAGALVPRETVWRIEAEWKQKIIDKDNHYKTLQDDVTFGGLIRRWLYDLVIEQRNSADVKARRLERELDLLNGVLVEKDHRMAALEDRATDADLAKKYLQSIRTQRNQARLDVRKKELQINATETNSWVMEQTVQRLEKRMRNHGELVATRDQQAESILALQQELHEAQVESRDLQQISHAEKTEINDLKSNVGTLEQRLQAMAGVLDFGGVDRLEADMRALEQQKGQMKKKVRNLEQEKSTVMIALKQQKSQLQKKIRNLEQEKSSLSQEFESKVTYLEDEKNEISQNLQQVQSNLSTSTQDLANARDQLATLQQNLTQTRNERDSSRQAYQATVTEEGQRRRDLRTRIDQLEGQLRQATTQANQELQNRNTRIVELENQLRHAVSQATQANQTSQNMHDGNKRTWELEGQLRQAAAWVTQIKQDLRSRISLVEQLEGRLRQAATRATQADQDLQSRNSRIEQLEGQLRRNTTEEQQTNALNSSTGGLQGQSGQDATEAQKEIDGLKKFVEELRDQLKKDNDKCKKAEAEANTQLEKRNDQLKQLRKDKDQLLKMANKAHGLQETMEGIRKTMSWEGPNHDLIEEIKGIKRSADKKLEEIKRSVAKKDEEIAGLINDAQASEGRVQRYADLLGEVCGGHYGQEDVKSVLRSLILHDFMLDRLFCEVTDRQHPNHVNQEDLRKIVEEFIDPEDSRKKLEDRLRSYPDQKITLLVKHNSQAMHLRESLLQTIEELPPNSLLINTVRTMILEQWKHSSADSIADSNSDADADADSDIDAAAAAEYEMA